MSAVFTRTDKALIDRAARHLKDTARELQRSTGPVWSATEGGKKAKRVYDRLMRDERDLRMLARRLEKIPATAAYPVGNPTVPLTTGDAGKEDADRMAAGFGSALDLTKAAVGG